MSCQRRPHKKVQICKANGYCTYSAECIWAKRTCCGNICIVGKQLFERILQHISAWRTLRGNMRRVFPPAVWNLPRVSHNPVVAFLPMLPLVPSYKYTTYLCSDTWRRKVHIIANKSDGCSIGSHQFLIGPGNLLNFCLNIFFNRKFFNSSILSMCIIRMNREFFFEDGLNGFY
jgi:hypothetical protein